MLNVLKKIVGTKNDRELRRLRPVVAQINALEPEMQALSDEGLCEKTAELRKRLADGDTLDDVLPEAFAAVREASRRTTGMRHFDVQLVGGMVLHQGKIAEMKTGEGKTLVATLALYLNALEGKGAHLITVNDYLARRDVQWMGPIYHALGLSVASILHEASYLYDPDHIVKDYRFQSLRPIERKEAYGADITYGTNNEFGFDYLRDNMKFSLQDYVQRELNFAIVDEVDNILIDEARTPLIISGPAEASTDKYYTIDRIIPKLRKDADYTVDEKLRQALLTDEGVGKVERMLSVPNLYDPTEIDTLHHVNQALRAHALFRKDVDYVVKEGQVIIVDEFTGRLMPGRRWSDGLHQAVEAKEGVKIQRENQTLATITIQNYFRMYSKLAGMTGTADTESVEFKKIYKLDVVVIPPNRPNIREDFADVVYRTEREKFDAVIEELRDCHDRGQPVLVGTVSVEKSERLSKLLKKAGIRHNVLNAVNHDLEASVIAQAGGYGTVTIATNMAGRGTDILLGGNPEFLARAEMENEWIQRVAKLANPNAAPAKRYEDTVREIRERYDEELERIRSHYLPRLQELDEKRKEALRTETETRQQLLAASPFRAARERYERFASNELIPALGDGRPVSPSWSAAKQDLEERLASPADAAGAGFVAAGEVLGAFVQEWADPAKRGQESVPGRDVRALLKPVVERWEEGPAGPVRDELRRLVSNLTAPEQVNGREQEKVKPLREWVNSARVHYDRVRNELEMELLLSGGSGPDGDVAAACRDASQLRETIESEHHELEVPYQKALADAHQRYEEQRQEYARTVAEVREQIDRAPQEFEEHFREKVAHFREVCAAEREKVVAAGGVHIVGTERHESRRIDNQLRGRSGRQGDPGSSRFFLSLEDDLLRIFGADRIQNLMHRLGMEEGVPIEHGLINKAVANAQGKVEAHHFDIRKHLLEYDDVMNKQREVVYHRRRSILAGEGLKEDVLETAGGLAPDIVASVTSAEIPPDEWDWKAIGDAVAKQFGVRLELSDEERAHISVEALAEAVVEAFRAMYEEKEREVERVHGPGALRQAERIIMLQTLDTLWKDHLLNMDHLKEGIGLRGYGQKNPLQEYQKEGFALFESMMTRFEEEVIERLATVQIVAQVAASPPRVTAPPRPGPGTAPEDARPQAASADTLAMMQRLEERRRAELTRQQRLSGPQVQPKTETVRRDQDKVGRNDPCPCGSGKKYKKCHGT